MPNPTLNLTIILLFLSASVLAMSNPAGESSETTVPSLVDATRPIDLRTDYRVTPLGIDRFPVELAWRMDAHGRRGAMQSAYRVQVAPTREALEKGALLWDSGKVESSQSAHVMLEELKPEPHRRYWWRVCIWDESQTLSAWAAATWFETGLLSEDDWAGADWIGGPPLSMVGQAISDEFDGAYWMMPALGDDEGALEFRTEVILPEGAYPVEAYTYWLVDGPAGSRSAVEVNKRSPRGSVVGNGKASWIDYAEMLRPGTNVIKLTVTKGPASKGAAPQSRALFAMDIHLGDGTIQRVVSGADWKTGGNQIQLGSPYKKAESRLFAQPEPYPALWFKDGFRIDKPVASARLYYSSLGYADAYLNGRKVGDSVLDPGLTDFEDWVLYTAHDVTELIVEGGNVWSIHLGPGFYHFPRAWGLRGSFSAGQPGWRGLLVVDYLDGTHALFQSNDQWRWRSGPTVQSDIFLGEVYDGRRAYSDWDDSGVTDDWNPVSILEQQPQDLQCQDFPPVRRIREISAVRKWQVAPQTWIFDFGENIAGWPRLQLETPEDQTVRIRVSEDCDAEGNFIQVPGSFWLVHSTFHRHTVIPGSEGVRAWEPSFIYHGFRYVEVSGLSSAPQADAVVAVVANTDERQEATFRSSNDLLNRMYDASIRTLHGNRHSFHQDCPTREKGMWGGDGYVCSMFALASLDAASFYRQSIRLWFTGPQPNGLPNNLGVGLRAPPLSSISWGGTPIGQAYQLWIYNGDLRPAREFYSNMRYFIAWFEENSPELIPEQQKYADHATPLNVPRVRQDKPLFATQTFYRLCRQFSAMAEALGEDEDARWSAELAERIRAVIVEKWYNADDGSLLVNSTHHSLAMDDGLIASSDIPVAAKSLSQIFKRNGYQFDAGVFGYAIYPMLSRYGYVDTAFDTITNVESLGIARSIASHDATTIWERFNENPRAQLVRSYNHPAMTWVGQWMIEYLGGIRPDPQHPGFQYFFLAPTFPSKLDWADVTKKSNYGVISSKWRRSSDGSIEWSVEVPPNSQAEVLLAVSGYQIALLNDEVPAEQVLHLGAGKYTISLRASRAPM